jgi:hypothetical protein
VGLGGPNLGRFIQFSEGTKTAVKASVFYDKKSPHALQIWKLAQSMTTAAWAEEGHLFNEDAESWLRLKYSKTDPDAKHCVVDSAEKVDGPEDQWVGE